MKDQLRMLVELQGMEQQKRVAAARKAKIDVEEVRLLWQEIRLLMQGLAANREQLAGLERACAARERDLAALTGQCQDLEKKLYGGEITNIKEIEQVRARCESLRREIGQRENDAVAGLEECERLAARVAGAEAGLQNKKRLHAEKQQHAAQVAARSDAEIAALEEGCRDLAARIAPPLLGQFRDLARRLPQPVAKVTGGICGGCRRSLPTSQAGKAQTKIVHCDNCGRMLLFE